LEIKLLSDSKHIIKIQLGYKLNSKPTAPKEFHISKNARDKYKFDEMLFSISGNIIFANFHAVRKFEKKINDKHDLINFPEKAVRAGQINALGLIDEILHYVVEKYRQEENVDISKQALEWLNEKIGKKCVNKALSRFAEEFPPVAVYQRKIDADEYLKSETKGIPNTQILLEEMVLLWLANANPACSPFIEFFNDKELEHQTSYLKIIDSLKKFFNSQPGFGPELQNLIDMLRSPAIEVPHSLSGQLQFMMDNWGFLLGKYLYRLLGSLDLIKEEEKMRFAFGPGPTHAYDFLGAEDEPERFSADQFWMPRLVLMAKSTLVWLDQLSKKYQQSITRLDEIPDEELDLLANWGFTGLWLIGLWERSRASKTIKQICGNPDAESSAYSLYDYVIADELGGDEAFFNLKERCWQRGIRLASDMVPNHTGIYSKWMIEHPDWYVGQDYCPFPSYSFNGQNLSDDDRVGIYIEDHYYDRTDAAVVFKRNDFHTGAEKYIYHGNDGTSMPWNDTAQLNYLNPEVREAAIQTILHVARRTPIIRFDAAMTLTKKHLQRLWFPEPGTGGDIPSRAEHGKTKADFDSQIPEEFWREVVDRIAREIPDTLLLAEAFWFMEGYFVRTLGMHRVYNSAFMNMLKNEENSKYREVIKKTLEFNPEILKRYVNFMNNPDEETAVAQFGKEDKYFGVCTMMVTMPGLPMFGHGQVEGFTEKYGMEYRRAYWDEQVDNHLVQRHDREIFPLMKKRYLFAEVQNFLLYDFYSPEGYVNENVFAYSNKFKGERVLVVYNNKFENGKGWIKNSSAYTVKNEDGTSQQLVQKSLVEGLSLRQADNYYTIFRDYISGLEYIRNNKQLCEQGLYVELDAFKYQVFLDFREVQDNEWLHYGQVIAYLDGRGVPSIDETLKEMILRPIHHKFEQLMNAETIHYLKENIANTKKKRIDTRLLDDIENNYLSLLEEVNNYTTQKTEVKNLAQQLRLKFEKLLELKKLQSIAKGKPISTASGFINDFIKNENKFWEILISWLLVHELGKAAEDEDFPDLSRSWIDEWLLGKIMNSVYQKIGLNESDSWQALVMVKILCSSQKWFENIVDKKRPLYHLLNTLLEDPLVQQYLQVNRYQDILWFNKESFESLVGWLFGIGALDSFIKSDNKLIERVFSLVMDLFEIGQRSGYRVDRLLEKAKALL
jgi:glycosidase/predicted metal-dependent HD superfamily phosphohydrolase